jgi:hypothetical protein
MVEAIRRSDNYLIKAVSAHLPYAVSQSQGGLAIVTPIDISAFPIRKWRDTGRKVIGIDCCLVPCN